jgi:hypothetical protein
LLMMPPSFEPRRSARKVATLIQRPATRKDIASLNKNTSFILRSPQ